MTIQGVKQRSTPNSSVDGPMGRFAVDGQASNRLNPLLAAPGNHPDEVRPGIDTDGNRHRPVNDFMDRRDDRPEPR
ncbi:MAG: hypothetical protein VX607_00525 [Planctomycetota bacterium]|nr:hypothetical protein [Planctomycetota bacterium]